MHPKFKRLATILSEEFTPAQRGGKLARDPLSWPQALEDHILHNPLSLGDRWDIVKMSGDEFKVESVESVAYLHGKTYYAGEPDATVSVIGKDSQGRSFKRQLPVDAKLVPNLIRLLNKIQPSGKLAARYSKDPYWMIAKYPGRDKDGKPFKKGDRVFYYPLTKTILTGPAAESAAAEFEQAAFDEDFGFRGV